MNVFGANFAGTATGEPSHSSASSHDDSTEHNKIGTVMLYGIPIVSLVIEGKERLCLAQISSTLLKDYSYNEIHNRRVALGITCAQCTPVQLELLRRAGAMPVTSRRCGMITRREAERLCKSFLGDHTPPKLPDNFAFDVSHQCAWGCRGAFLPSRYNSSRAKCIRCLYCGLFFSPNKFIFHSHRLPDSKYVEPDAANFNSWRRHIHLTGNAPEEVVYAWEDVKAMFNGGSRKRAHPSNHHNPLNSKEQPLMDGTTSTSDSEVPTPEPTPVVINSKAPHAVKLGVNPKRSRVEADFAPALSNNGSPVVQNSAVGPLTGPGLFPALGMLQAVKLGANPKRPRLEGFCASGVDFAPDSTNSGSPSVQNSAVGPLTGPGLFPALGMILPSRRTVNSEPIIDYVWNSNRLWNPYLNTLPLNSYLYNCGYLMKPELSPWNCRPRPVVSGPLTQPSSAVSNNSATADYNRDSKPLQTVATSEDEAETIVDVESTDT